MRFLLITRDDEVRRAAEAGSGAATFEVFADWAEALEASEGADLLFVDLVATLNEPHKIAGYEQFAQAKMEHPLAKSTPLVLIGPPEGYGLDFMAGWPDFVFYHVKRPVTANTFQRAAAYLVLARTQD